MIAAVGRSPQPVGHPAELAAGGRREGLALGTLPAAAVVAIFMVLAGCATAPPPRSTGAAGDGAGGGAGEGRGQGQAETRRGGYYLDDGPGARTLLEIEALAALPDPVPVVEPLHPWANRPYRVLGNDYQPMTQRRPFMEQGIASWYGRKFHGQPTSTGERYDMYGMTAAHPTLPLPSYARVTNLDNGRSVVVRINDRGPFLHGRAIDLSYLAAHKLGYAQSGSARVSIEVLDPASSTPAAGGRSPVGAAVVETTHAVPTSSPAAPPAEAHYLQLGAFGSAANADAASGRLRGQLDWLRVPIEVAPADGLFRVQAGPYPLREQAARAGAEIESRTGLRPLLLPPLLPPPR